MCCVTRGSGGEGMGGEGRGGGNGGQGRGGEGTGGEGRGGREGGEGGEECYTYSNGPQHLNSSYVTYYVITCQSAFEYNNDVTYYVITCKSPFDWVYIEQWYCNYYVRRDVDRVKDRLKSQSWSPN